jgi:hypothetical protein
MCGSFARHQSKHYQPTWRIIVVDSVEKVTEAKRVRCFDHHFSNAAFWKKGQTIPHKRVTMCFLMDEITNLPSDLSWRKVYFSFIKWRIVCWIYLDVLYAFALFQWAAVLRPCVNWYIQLWIALTLQSFDRYKLPFTPCAIWSRVVCLSFEK